MAEGTHGEIDAYVTPAADIVGHTIDGLDYDMGAQLNYTAVQSYYSENNQEVFDDLMLAPRKVFTGTKVMRESRSGLYNETSLMQQK